MQRIVLASGSPRRKQLLEWAEIPFDILVKETPETWPPGLAVAEVQIGDHGRPRWLMHSQAKRRQQPVVGDKIERASVHDVS